jgi:hypothetical protein
MAGNFNSQQVLLKLKKSLNKELKKKLKKK